MILMIIKLLTWWISSYSRDHANQWGHWTARPSV